MQIRITTPHFFKELNQINCNKQFFIFLENTFYEKLDCVTKLLFKNLFWGFHCLKGDMNKIFGNCQLLMSRFWDIVVCLNFLWKSTEQALSHLSHCSRKVRMLNTCARAKITWYAKGRKQNNCWPFFSACPHMFLFKSLLAAKILVMISKLSNLSKLWTAKG